MSRPLARRVAVLTAVGSCLAAAALPAVAAGPTVTDGESSTVVSLAAPEAGTRQLRVLDLAGAELTDLELRPGTPAPFRVQVVDDGVGHLTELNADGKAVSGFTVQALMNNLYLDGNANGNDYIAAEDIDVAFAPGALRSLGGLTALPDLTLSGTLTCDPALDALGLTLSDLLALSVAGTLTSLQSLVLELCNTLTTAGQTITALGVDSTVERALSALQDLPFALTGQEAFTFDADYTTGKGLEDTVRGGPAGARIAGTPRPLLVGTPALTTGLTTTLTGLAAALEGVEPVQVGVQDGVATFEDVFTGLSAAAMGELASLLAEIHAADPGVAAPVLNVLAVDVLDFDLDDLTDVTAQYNSFPVMTATPSSPKAGAYSGHMTVTLVQP